MARFSALTSDSSDDEQTPYKSQDVQKQVPASPTKSVDMDPDLFSSGSEEEVDIEVDEDDEDEESEESDGTSHMDEDDLVAKKPTATRKQALVEDSDGEIRYKLRAQSRSSSLTSSEPDSDDVRRRGVAVAPWRSRAGMDAQKMHVMQTSLFRMPEEAAALQAMNRPTRPRFKISPTVSRKHSRDSVGDARFDSQEVCGTLTRYFISHDRF